MSFEKLNQTQTRYTTKDEKWPTSLKTAKEISEQLRIPEERIKELADGHFLPHWRVNGGVPLFQLAEVKKWAAKNLLERVDGEELPFELRLMVLPPKALPENAPPEIREIKNLRQMNTADASPGVYFLVKKNKVVYVGQSVTPYARIASHRDKKFDSAYMIPVPSSMLNAVEGALIRAMNPPLNSGDKNIAIGPGKREDDFFSLRRFADGFRHHALIDTAHANQEKKPHA